MRLQLPLLALVLALAPACGDDKGGGSSGSTSAGTTENTSQSTGQGTSTGGTDASTTDDPTTGATGTGTGTESGTGATDSGTTDSGTGSTTGTVLPDFERFKQANAAGPCPGNSDCDGFVELLSTRLLRVEEFGELGNPVTEIEISEDDFAAAVAVFADEALVALLDGPDPVCQPPTDVFESMEVVIDGKLHDASTTTCDSPPLVAAREKVNELRMKYAP